MHIIISNEHPLSYQLSYMFASAIIIFTLQQDYYIILCLRMNEQHQEEETAKDVPNISICWGRMFPSYTRTSL
jgi:hypothetical protein